MVTDIYNLILSTSTFQKVSNDGLLASLYVNRNDDSLKKVWSFYNSLAYVIEGEKHWHTENGWHQAKSGHILFCQKGGQIAFNCREGITKVLLIFFPDDFVRSVCLEYPQIYLRENNPLPTTLFKVYPLREDPLLGQLMESFYSYFFEHQLSSAELLHLKFKELIVQIMSGSRNQELCRYLKRITDGKVNQLTEVMENNYLFNMSLEEFAQLANCSLSTFKREFAKIYNTTPGKWLINKRLEYARNRLLTTTEHINEVAYLAGFENTSHFIRAFKSKFGQTPSTLRQH